MRYLRATMVAACVTGAVAVPAGATAQTNSVQLGSAPLGPQRASVTVPVTVRCDPGWNVQFISVNVVQEHGDWLAQGAGFFNSQLFPGNPCSNGFTWGVTVPDSSIRAFAIGEAFATANVDLFNAETFGSVTATESASIRIVGSGPYVDPLSHSRSSAHHRRAHHRRAHHRRANRRHRS
jgi:hypothetical protein